MGVTIHFEGCLKGRDQCDALLQQAKAFSIEHGWTVEPIEESQTTLHRVIDERDVDYVGPVSGLTLHPHPNSEPLRLEIDNQLFLQEYCKTQFAGAEIHIKIVGLLRSIAPLFSELRVYDEGEYWETEDEDILRKHFEETENILNAFMRKNPGAYGPVRLPSGRIADIVNNEEGRGEGRPLQPPLLERIRAKLWRA